MTLIAATVLPDAGWLSTDTAMFRDDGALTGQNILKLHAGRRCATAVSGPVAVAIAFFNGLRLTAGDSLEDALQVAERRLPILAREMHELMPGQEFEAVLIGWSDREGRVNGWIFHHAQLDRPTPLPDGTTYHRPRPIPASRGEAHRLRLLATAMEEGRRVGEYHLAAARNIAARQDSCAGGDLYVAQVLREGATLRRAGALTRVNAAPVRLDACLGAPPPAQGAGLSAPASLRFTPNPGFVGRASFDFTITNGAKSSTGRCIVTVTSPVTPPVDARNDTVSILRDGSLTFDPRANDLPATGLTITALGVIPVGSASIRDAGTRILITPPPGYTGSYSFTYTVGDGLTTDTAAISVLVQAPAVSTEYPTPASTVTVDSRDDLLAEIASASGSAWKRIVCEDGSYGAVTIGKAKVQVYSESLNGAVFTSVVISGADSILARAKVASRADEIVQLNAARSRVSRCLIDGLDQAQRGSESGPSAKGVMLGADFCEVDGCEFTGTSQAIEGSPSCTNWVIRRNWMYNQGAVTSDKHAWVYIGSGGPESMLAEINGLYERNRTEKAGFHQHLEIKGTGCRVIGNTHVGGSGSPPASVYTRTGMGNYYALNFLVGSGVVGLAGNGDIAVKNRGRLGVRAGDTNYVAFQKPPVGTGKKGVMRADNALVVAHQGTIVMGYNEGVRTGLETPKGTILEDTSQATISHQFGTSTYTTRARTIPIPEGELRELTAPDDVGQRWGENLPPVKANPDTASTTAGVAVEIRPLANDTGEPTEIASYSQPATGTGAVTSPAPGVLRFTPAAGFRGRATFNYEATNGLTSDIDTITVDVA